MKKIDKGTVCMVVNNCMVHRFDTIPYNIKGHLVYGKGAFFGHKTPHVFDSDFGGFTVVNCDSSDLVAIDPNNLEKSLSSAYRKTRPLGRINPKLKIPLIELKREYSRYEEHFNEYIAKK